jgi:hypothetical protein
MSRSWFLNTILILSILFLLFGIFELIPFENQKINKGISAIGFLLQALFFSRMFWYKNYVQWNNKGATIRINTIFGKSIVFEHIKSIEIDEKTLILTQKNGKKVMFDLSDIADSDAQKLNNIIVKHAIANHL